MPSDSCTSLHLPGCRPLAGLWVHQPLEHVLEAACVGDQEDLALAQRLERWPACSAGGGMVTALIKTDAAAVSTSEMMRPRPCNAS